MFKRVVKEYETAILWKHGQIAEYLTPGQHPVLPWNGERLERFDMRAIPLEVSGQEVMLADRTSIKINVAATTRLIDPVLRVKVISNEHLDLYINQVIQLALRKFIGEYTLDTLFDNLSALNSNLAVHIPQELAKIGVALVEVSVKDIILPADLRAAYVEVASAHARGEA